MSFITHGQTNKSKCKGYFDVRLLLGVDLRISSRLGNDAMFVHLNVLNFLT